MYSDRMRGRGRPKKSIVPPVKLKTVRKICRICRSSFKPVHSSEVLCLKCRGKLPKCDACHTVMGRQYGFLEDPDGKVGKFNICTSCALEIENKGFLHIGSSTEGRIKNEVCLLSHGQTLVLKPGQAQQLRERQSLPIPREP